MSSLTPQEAKQITEEAYLFAYSMLENYKTMYVQAINENNPAYRAPFNQVSHMRQLLTHEFTAVVGPNNDTLYSLAWLDLGTEPQVLSLPDIPDDRYYVFQICDMYTFNIEYIGARTTGHKAAKYLFAGPGWDGSTLEGIDGVRRTEGRFLFLLGRTAVSGVEDVPAVNALQDQYRLMPLSAYLGQNTPEPVPAPDFPPYNPEKADSIEFISYFNFLMGQMEPGPDERPLLEKWAQIGVKPGAVFDPEALAPEIRVAAGLAGGGCPLVAQNGGVCQSGYRRGHGLDGATGRDHDHHPADRPAPAADWHLGHLLGYRLRADHPDPGAAGGEPVCARPLSGSRRLGSAPLYPGFHLEPAISLGTDGGIEFQRCGWFIGLRRFAGQPDFGDPDCGWRLPSG
jgi:hypothetical protein